jgi:regulator of sirC expression with transglutaminase-like and TPR domain
VEQRMTRDDNPEWAADPMAFLSALGKADDDAFDPGVAALAFAAIKRPHTAFARYEAHLHALATEAAAHAAHAGSAIEQASALAEVIYQANGYSGDTLTYDDLQNADLVRVIDRKKGLPVALGILNMSIAYRLGWSLVGLAFPGHFLLRLDHGGERLALDPFDNARVVDAAGMRDLLKRMQGEGAELTAEHYQPVSNRDVLLRLQNNIKLRRLRAGDIPGALENAEAMLAFAPDIVELMREIAMMHMRLENIGQAIRGFEKYLAAEPEEGLRHKAAKLLQELKHRLN